MLGITVSRTRFRYPTDDPGESFSKISVNGNDGCVK